MSKTSFLFHVKHRWSRWYEVPTVNVSAFGATERTLGQRRECVKCNKAQLRKP